MSIEQLQEEYRHAHWPFRGSIQENYVSSLTRNFEKADLPLKNALAKALVLNALYTVPELLGPDMLDQDTIAALLEVNMDMDEINRILRRESNPGVNDIEQRWLALSAYIRYFTKTYHVDIVGDSTFTDNVINVTAILDKKIPGGFPREHLAEQIRTNSKPLVNSDSHEQSNAAETGQQLALKHHDYLLKRMTPEITD